MLDVPSNVVQKKRVAWILFFKIRPSQEILKIRDGTPFEEEEILTSSQDILKIHYGTPLEAEEILTYIKNPRNGSVWQSQEILKIRDGTPLEAEEILTYLKKPRNRSIWYFSSKLDVPSNVVRVARILIFKIRSSQEILKIHDGTPLEAKDILTYIKKSQNRSIWYFSSKLDLPSNVVQKKRVVRILIFKIRPSQEFLKICDGTPLEAEDNLTYIKKSQNGSIWYFSSKLDYLVMYKPSQEILKIRDGIPLEIMARILMALILFFKIRPSQYILKIRDGTPLEIMVPFEGGRNFDIHKKPSKQIGLVLLSKLDVSSNVVQKKRVAQILFFKFRPSRESLKIRDGTPLEAEDILTYIKKSQNGSIWYFSSKLDVPSNVVQRKRVVRILIFKIRPSQEILKIRYGTPLEAKEILIYKKTLEMDRFDTFLPS
ncbi:hypothetical protein OROHE_026808 [Orobanche hederae]